MRVLVVINPRATTTSTRARDVLVSSLASIAEVEVAVTANRGHAAAIACRAMRARDTEAVIALGGDGTVNEVVNGLLTDGPHPAVPKLGVVPAGSTNVFARALGLANDPFEATGQLLEALRRGRHRPISLGRADERWFVFGVGVGLSAAIVAAVEKKRARGARPTNLLYARAGLPVFWREDRRHPALSAELNDGTVLAGAFMAVVTNTDPWTYAGQRPLRPTPGTSFDTGLGLYARRRMSTLGMVFSMAAVSGNRPRIGRRGAYLHQDVDALTIRASKPVPVEIDGDYVGEREQITLSAWRSAIGVIC